MATIRGVEYYNDSKATNVDATIKALESFPANMHLILGGKDKDSDYSSSQRFAAAAGEARLHDRSAAEKIESQIKGRSRDRPCRDAGDCARHAAATAQSGDVVLLAPACASFDQFQNYEHRGQVFKEVVAGARRERQGFVETWGFARAGMLDVGRARCPRQANQDSYRPSTEIHRHSSPRLRGSVVK